MHLLTGRWQLSATRLALLLALFFTLLNYGFFRTIWQAWRGVAQAATAHSSGACLCLSFSA